MKKVFLTSAICMLCALPSYADIASNASNATCDNSTIGATEGSTDLEAQWTALTYSENPGYYLLFANDTISQHQTCPAGYYCEGFTDETFADASIGLQSCAEYDSDFPNSAAGTSNANYCYNTGTVQCSALNPYTAGHGTATYANTSATYKAYSDWGPVDITSSRSGFFLDTLGACAFTLTCDPGYTATSAGPLANYVTQTVMWDSNPDIKYRALNGDSGSNSGNSGQGSHTGMTAGAWSVAWPDGTTVSGSSACTTTAGTDPWGGDDYELIAANVHASGDFTAGDYGDASSGKQYCYCRMDNYKLLSNGSTTNVASPSWVFSHDIGSASDCAANCALDCANLVQIRSGFRSAFFGSLGANPECSANTISIDWDPKNGDAHTQNQCTYGGAVTIPAQPTKAGYTFGGWRIKPTTPAE